MWLYKGIFILKLVQFLIFLSGLKNLIFIYVEEVSV